MLLNYINEIYRSRLPVFNLALKENLLCISEKSKCNYPCTKCILFAWLSFGQWLVVVSVSSLALALMCGSSLKIWPSCQKHNHLTAMQSHFVSFDGILPHLRSILAFFQHMFWKNKFLRCYTGLDFSKILNSLTFDLNSESKQSD